MTVGSVAEVNTWGRSPNMPILSITPDNYYNSGDRLARHDKPRLRAVEPPS